MLKKITKNSSLIFILLAVVLALPAVFGLLHSGFPLTDDGNWMVIRFSAFYENLRAGQFPVRFLTRLNFGYGYPVSDFLYPLFMYIGAPIHILGFNFFNTVKIILILFIVSSSVFSYLWLRKIFDNISSLVGSLIYVFFPYHLYDVYVRGSVGEVLSLGILPFVLWQLEKKNLLLSSLGIAFLITAHNTLAFLFVPLIFVYGLTRDKRISRFNVLTMLLGICASSFFWIPALFDSKYTVFSKTTVSDFSSYFINANLGLLGIIFVFIIAESMLFLFRKKNKKFAVLILFTCVLGFLTLSQSLLIWKIIPLTNLIQFPFRIISLMIPISAFIAAFLLNKEDKTKKNILIIIYLILIIISAVPFLTPKSYSGNEDSFYSTNQDTTTVKNEYMPIWVKNIPNDKPQLKINNLTGEELITINQTNVNKISFNTALNSAEEISINTIYFPGWNAYSNGKKIEINYRSNGLINLRLPKGENNVLLEFTETPVRIFADLLSIIGFIFILSLGFISKRYKFKIL